MFCDSVGSSGFIKASVYNVLQYFLKLSAPTTSDKLKQAANAYEEEVAEEMELLTLDMVRKIRFLAKEISSTC